LLELKFIIIYYEGGGARGYWVGRRIPHSFVYSAM